MSELKRGVVLRMDAKVCHVEVDGEVVLAAPRGALFENLEGVKNPVAVGDHVEIDPSGDPVSLVNVLPRRNQLSRTASSHDPREQVLAANVDQLFVIASVKSPKFSSNRTDRILAACEWHGIPSVLVLNKTDLAKPKELDALRATYASVPVEMIETCATDGKGVGELRERLRGKTSILYGASGAGKSTLLNALQPGLRLKVGKISSYWEQGKHTTTYSQLHHLDFGADVIDTPGIRVFRIHDIHRSELKGLFPEFARYEDRCKFPNCTHDHEPDCAVLDALEEGEIARTRYMSYLEMLMEASPDPIGYDDVEEPEDA
ncbi:MAG: ribosome small subunit-dependent GTPase A [Planctomycetes bacterium]|nr:ribosome small subunit-dependent GTPase A [Planctomycetota bacterium]MCB9904947.1 ribosome small subunit-dependent GTPase A [Planctomycetota bacterium]